MPDITEDALLTLPVQIDNEAQFSFAKPSDQNQEMNLGSNYVSLKDVRMTLFTDPASVLE